MRLRELTVGGFRGFNEERTISFGDRLTLICAPNSYGKTSVSEALEFLFFGYTSKVAHADSKEEYRDSYRNRHWPRDKAAYVRASVIEADGLPSTLLIELDASGDIRRFLNGKPVREWAFARQAGAAASPFILQHALKYLLLVAPNERFQGFARLLGLDEVDDLQRAIVSLCTKPEVTIPPEGRKCLAELAAIESRMAGLPALEKPVKELKKGVAGMAAAYSMIEARSDAVLGKKVPATERLTHLIRLRDDLAAKVYSGSVAIRSPDEDIGKQLTSDEISLATLIADTFIEDYAKLAARGIAGRLAREAELLSIGVDFIAETPAACPLCGQTLDETLRKHITERHKEAKAKAGPGQTVQDARARVDRVIESIRTPLARHRRTVESRCSDLLSAMNDENGDKVEKLFGKSNQSSWDIVRAAAADVAALRDAIVKASDDLEAARGVCETATKSRTEETAQSEVLGKAVNGYLASARALASRLDQLEPTLLGPARILRQAIDALAGTSELTLLIDFLENRAATGRALKVRNVLEELKELKKSVEQTVGETMEAAISADLTVSVMNWYGRIRTKGDPDVHFSGFAMDRTKSGEFKKGKVKVNAHSYGVGLTSAVSSLSESKLNALGLCVSIASALGSPGPWEFLVLDDPIQSWDADHETQFIDAVRALAETEGRQIILLTHKSDWARQVCMGCRTLNGVQYEITGYTKEGPLLREVEWASVDQRLREADKISNCRHATSVKLQQAEEEVRIAACQLASDIAELALGRTSSAHKMNCKDVRDILTEAGCPSELVDRVYAAFGTADDAHHAPKGYTVNAQRVRRYVSTLRELRSFRDKAKKRTGA